MKNVKKVIVALDFSSKKEALDFLAKLDPALCAVKVGSELFTLLGPDFVRHLIKTGYSVFLDLKFHDIPNTVAKACVAAAELGVWMINIHASGGLEMMKAAVNAIKSQPAPPLLMAVTVLTSLDDESLKAIGIERNINHQVEHLAKLAKLAGCDGVVCGAEEVPLIKSCNGEDFLTVTPGIRFQEDCVDDQSRVVTPEEAIRLGSDFLVLGRSIYASSEPILRLKRLCAGQF